MERVSPERQRKYEQSIQSIFEQYIMENYCDQIQVDNVDLAIEKKSYANITFSSNQRSILEAFESSYSNSNYSKTIQFQSTRHDGGYSSHLLLCYCVYVEAEIYYHAYGDEMPQLRQQDCFNNYNQSFMPNSYKSPQMQQQHQHQQQQQGFGSIHYQKRRFVSKKSILTDECKALLTWIVIFLVIIFLVWVALSIM